MPLPSFVDEFERNEVHDATVRAFQRESQHFELGFNLFRETVQYVCLLASTMIGDQAAWNTSQAILGGHLVRMFKLMRFFLEEAMQNRAEQIWVVARLLAECVINFRFLVERASPEVFESYIHHSLQYERELHDLILSNIANRGGQSLPIEDRMLASIQRTFEDSQVELSQLSEKRIRNWAGMNLFEKARSVELGEAYLGIFGGPSRNVHGGWQDLLQHHLERKGPGTFSPQLEFTAPRPQLAFTLSYLIAPSLIAYVKLLDHPDLTPLLPRLEDLVARVRRADDLHEEFLAACGLTSACS